MIAKQRSYAKVMTQGVDVPIYPSGAHSSGPSSPRGFFQMFRVFNCFSIINRALSLIVAQFRGMQPPRVFSEIRYHCSSKFISILFLSILQCLILVKSKVISTASLYLWLHLLFVAFLFKFISLLKDWGKIWPLVCLIIHRKMDRERVNRILEDMLRMYVMHQERRWEEYLPLVEFAYDNGYQESLRMSSFEALYGQSCSNPISWSDLVNKVWLGPNMLEEMEQEMQVINKNLNETYHRQTIQADQNMLFKEFCVGDMCTCASSPRRSP